MSRSNESRTHIRDQNLGLHSRVCTKVRRYIVSSDHKLQLYPPAKVED